MAHVIVLGNEKGGSGKTTTAMHLIVTLLKLGLDVAAVDIDSRQRSLARYIENRQRSVKDFGLDLEIPSVTILTPSANRNKLESEKDEEKMIKETIAKHSSADFIVIDTPGSDACLSRMAHMHANTVITPINDSFVDLDLIGNIDPKTLESTKPGVYSAMLWDQKVKRASQSKEEIKWFVVRNRLSSLDAINKRKVEEALNKLSKKFGFKIASGFGDRVIFKELFLHGLTLHDATQTNLVRFTPSVLGARQELRNFIDALGISTLESAMAHYNDVMPTTAA